MLNPISFTMVSESGPVHVTANGLDYAAYEERFNMSVVTAISERRYTTWMFLTWSAMTREDKTTLSFEEFLASTPEFAQSAEVEALVPLESSPPTGESSTSPTSSD